MPAEGQGRASRRAEGSTWKRQGSARRASGQTQK